MTGLWDPRYFAVGFSEFPQLKSFAVADSIGQGAAVASMVNLGLVLSPVDLDNDHLGTFLFTKDDRYYFGGGPPVIFKNVVAGTYKGSQLINPGGGIANAAAVDAIIDATMALNGDPLLWNGSVFQVYNGTEYQGCAPTNTPANCITLLNALFSGGDFGAEANTGTEPGVGDPRFDALEGAAYFADACPPVGSCIWDKTGIFLMAP